ncbi:hypothetical protein [Nonomuraea sp. NPDC003754]
MRNLCDGLYGRRPGLGSFSCGGGAGTAGDAGTKPVDKAALIDAMKNKTPEIKELPASTHVCASFRVARRWRVRACVRRPPRGGRHLSVAQSIALVAGGMRYGRLGRGGDGQKKVLEICAPLDVENVVSASSQGHEWPRWAA